MRRYTTPTIELTIEGIDLTESDVMVTFAQNDYSFTISGTDLAVTFDGENTVITCRLSETETGKFQNDYYVEIQVNWVSDGERNATDIAYVMVDDNLQNESIE